MHNCELTLFLKNNQIAQKRFHLKKNIFARDGDRTHAHIRELDLKSNALTTRPPGLTIQFINIDE